MRFYIKLLLVIISILLFLITLNYIAGNFNTTFASSNILPQHREFKAKKTLRIATEGNLTPFNSKKPNGELFGFEIDLIDALCAEMKRNCEMVDHDWEGMILGLKENKFDAIISQIMITPERLRSMSYTDPYYESTIYIFGHKGKSVKNIEEITHKKVGAQRGTVYSKYIEDNHPDWQEKLFDTQNSMYNDFVNGRLDYFLSELGTVKYGIIDRDSLVTVGAKLKSGLCAIGIKKENHQLLSEFNQALNAIKRNGIYYRIYQKYFSKPS